MLRVGLTGELGSGKSTVARLLAQRGARVLSSDEMARTMMQPGQTVYRQIVERFGSGVMLPDGALDRRELARLAFDPERPQVEELNRIVHPAVLREQEDLIAEIARAEAGAVVVVESALILTTRYGGSPWRERFDRLVLVEASDEIKTARFVERMAAGRLLSPDERMALWADANQRLAAQRIPHDSRVDFVIANERGIDELGKQVDDLWGELQKANGKPQCS